MAIREHVPSILFLLLTCAVSSAEVPDDMKSTTIGGEFQINSYTSFHQHPSAVAITSNGDFVVVWRSFGTSGTDSSSYSIQGHRYASDGSSLGIDFQVNSYTTSNQQSPSVAASAEGHFVVVWTSDGSDGTDTNSSSIQGQRFSSDGVRVGGEFQVNTITTSSQVQPSVVTTPEGDFVVVWTSADADLSDGAVQGQRFSSAGMRIGDEFTVNSYTTSFQGRAVVASAPEGGFVVTWISYGSSGTDSSINSIQARRFGSNGSPLGSQFQVNTYTSMYQSYPDLAVDASGGFVVVWASYGSTGTDSEDWSIQGQRHASDGSFEGGEFQINTTTTLSQLRPSVAAYPSGDFLVVWDSWVSAGTDTSDFSIQGQRFTAGGLLSGNEFQVNTYTPDDQFRPRVAVAPNGLSVVAWDSEGSGGTDVWSTSIQGQLFVLEADLVVTNADGVTSAEAGGGLTYTVVASNAGPGTASEVTVVDIFPPELTCAWVSLPMGGATGQTSSSGNLDDTLTLPAGSAVTYTIECDIDLFASGTLLNIVTISSPLSDPNPGNNSAADSDTVLITPIFADGFESGDTMHWAI